MRSPLQIALLAGAVLLCAHCATAPPAPAPGRVVLHGRLDTAPKEGAPAAGGGAYGDRRLADVERVDYSRVDLGVVYVVGEDRPAPEDRARFALVPGRVAPRIEPRDAVVGLAGRIAIHNGLEQAEWVSIPALDVLASVEPGGSLEVPMEEPGELEIHLLSSGAEPPRVFVAPGPFAVVRGSGRFALPDLRPGRVELRAWHPRLPPWARSLELRPDETLRVDVELGVGRDGAGGEGS